MRIQGQDRARVAALRRDLPSPSSIQGRPSLSSAMQFQQQQHQQQLVYLRQQQQQEQQVHMQQQFQMAAQQQYSMVQAEALAMSGVHPLPLPLPPQAQRMRAPSPGPMMGHRNGSMVPSVSSQSLNGMLGPMPAFRPVTFLGTALMGHPYPQPHQIAPVFIGAQMTRLL